MAAFAANSILCRLALASESIDPAGFTLLRLASGAATLWALTALRSAGPPRRPAGSWGSAAALFVYAAGFSLAYVSLSAGTGALILFAAVQATMILGGLAGGERPGPAQWGGLALAMAGLVFLVLPGLAAPSPGASALMAGAGVAWGVYSLRGRGVSDPAAETAGNFARAAPLAAVLALVLLPDLEVTPAGAGWAVLSGAAASGLGYVAWYAAVRALSATRAAVVQLSVPVLAAAGGAVFLGETVTARLVLSSVGILGGIALAVIPIPAKRTVLSVRNRPGVTTPDRPSRTPPRQPGPGA